MPNEDLPSKALVELLRKWLYAFGSTNDLSERTRAALLTADGLADEPSAAQEWTPRKAKTAVAITMLGRFRDGRMDLINASHETIAGPRDQLKQEWDLFVHAIDVLSETLRAAVPPDDRLKEAEALILRMSGEGYSRARFYVEKYDLTGERTSATKPAAPESDDTSNWWKCSNCKARNHPEYHHTSCPNCRTLRPAVEKKPALWTCPQCGSESDSPPCFACKPGPGECTCGSLWREKHSHVHLRGCPAGTADEKPGTCQCPANPGEPCPFTSEECGKRAVSRSTAGEKDGDL